MERLGGRVRVFTDEEFAGLDVSGVELRDRVFEDCTFRACRFVGAMLPETRFVGCRLEDCDLSGAVLAGASFHETHFLRCRLRGVDFSAAASWRLPRFRDCVLDEAGLIGVELPGLVLRGGSARTACFQGARLRKADFRDLDLTGAVFGGTDLREADLRGATGYALDPTANRVTGMRVTWPEAAALVEALGVRLGDDEPGAPAR